MSSLTRIDRNRPLRARLLTGLLAGSFATPCIVACVSRGPVTNPEVKEPIVPPEERAPRETDADFASITSRDIDAIDAWVRAFYPAVVDPWHEGFEARWSTAVADAKARASQVEDGTGWTMTMEALVNSLRDGHVYVNPSDSLPKSGRAPQWPGYVVERLGDSYVLHAHGDAASLDGARLRSCDGIPIEQFAEATLDLYRGDWTIEAERRRVAPLLLLDTGNPFVQRAKTCEVDLAGTTATWHLAWTELPRERVSELVSPYQGIKRDQRARVDLAFADDGAAWITLGNLTDEAAYQALDDVLRKSLRKVRRAPYVVWDVRGNGGGNSAMGFAVMATVWGEPPVQRPQLRAKQWRSSPEVVALMREARAVAAKHDRPGLVQFVDAILPQLEAAASSGAALHAEVMPGDAPVDGATAVGSTERGDAGRPERRESKKRSKIRGPVFVLTDGGCFSSCIMVVTALRDMGAQQVGLSTGRNTIYGESWFNRDLPSGFGALTLPIAIFGENPELLGGGPPDLRWTGSPTDEDGLRAFVAEAANHAKRGPRGTPSPASGPSNPAR